MHYAILQKGQIEEAKKCLISRFIDEPMGKHLGLGKDELETTCFPLLTNKNYLQNTLVATNESGELTGICLNDLNTVENLYLRENEEVNISAEKTKIITRLLNTLSKPFLEKTYTENKKLKMFHLSMLAVDKNHSGKKIASHLIKKSIELAYSKGADFIFMEATGNASQQISKNLGFTMLHEIKYSSFLYDKKKVFRNLKHIESCKLMVKDIRKDSVSEQLDVKSNTQAVIT